MGEVLLWLGLVAATVAASVCLLAGERRLALAGGWIALLLAPVLVVADNWEGPRLVDLRETPLLALAALALALAAVWLLARTLRGRPGLFALLVVAVVAFRIPVELGGTTSNLLVPLYAVIAAGTLAMRPDDEPDEVAPARAVRRPLTVIAALLAAFIVVYALQAGYADDLSGAVERICFFFVPFAVLFRLLSWIEWTPRLLRAALVVVVVEALVVAVFGFGEYASRELLWNEKVISGNEAHAWFRVNSLFFDPNIMGRFLALVLVGLAGVVTWARTDRDALAAAAAFVVILGALAITYSVSSMLALFAGLLALVAIRWGVRSGAAASAACALALVAIVVAIGGSGDLAEETTGRTGLIDGGIELASDRPIIGYGSGSFADEFTDRFGAGPGIAVESHTEPVTVAAEQGLIGLVPYAALVVAALVGLAGAVGLLGGRAPDPALATIGAMLALMVVHSLGYAAFMIDPVTWVLLALAVAIAVSRGSGEVPAADPAPAGIA